MYKRNYICLSACILWVITAVQPAVLAQHAHDNASTDTVNLAVGDESKRKSPSFFHRPSKDSSAAQLGFANKLLSDGKQKAAMKQFSALVHKWHTSPEAPAAQLAYARILYDRKDYTRAFDEFQYLVDNFAGQFPYEEALDKQFRVANYLMTARRMKFLFIPGFRIQEQALPLFEKIVKNGPNWKSSVEAQFNIGVINEELGNHDEAIKAYDLLRYHYPDSERSVDASFRKAYCLYLAANANMRDETQCRLALSALAGFAGDYPKHGSYELAVKYRDELDARLANMNYERAVFYDKSGKIKAAIIAYEDYIRKFPLSKLAGNASARIEILKGKLEKNK